MEKSKLGHLNKIDVILEYLLTLFPSKFESAYRNGSNAPKTKAQDAECQTIFPINNCVFQVPFDHTYAPSEGDYAVVEGMTICCLHWEYVNPKYCSNISCPYCESGKLERQQCNFTKYGKVIPVLSTSDELAFTVSMLYKCKINNV